MYNLANMYYSGTGTVKDLKMSYKMFLKSKINGITESEFFIKEISNILKPEELSVLNANLILLLKRKLCYLKLVNEYNFLLFAHE